jgi:hypothetical protein
VAGYRLIGYVPEEFGAHRVVLFDGRGLRRVTPQITVGADLSGEAASGKYRPHRGSGILLARAGRTPMGMVTCAHSTGVEINSRRFEKWRDAVIAQNRCDRKDFPEPGTCR